jgi:transposase
MSDPKTLDQSPLQTECEQLRRKVGVLEVERQQLELKVRQLQQELWGRKSERLAPVDTKQVELFADPTNAPAITPKPGRSPVASTTRTGQPKGPKPLDPALPRETVAVPAPEPRDLICPVTKKPMQPGFVETLEVLARRPAVYYVKRYERTVFVSPAKTAPVYTPWPADVLSRSRVHASVVAHVAVAHYADHQPFYRIEQQLARTGVELPRNCQVSLMRQLDELLQPLVTAMKADVLGSDYVFLDATPVPVCDPQRPGATREATLWAYRNAAGTVWFDYQASKSPQAPDRALKDANFRGLLHTDGASGLGDIGPPGQVTSLGCFAHLRRYFFKAWQAGDPQAEPYLRVINRLFRRERLARRFGLTLAKREKLRTRYSVPAFEALLENARAESASVLPKSPIGSALHYLLAQQAPLRRCLEHARAELSTNPVERAIRPLKLGAKNWLQIGHPDAGPRLANLFTVVENCRQLSLDPEAYLIDLLTRLPDHPNSRVAELLPRAWRDSRPAPAAATTAADASAADRSR